MQVAGRRCAVCSKNIASAAQGVGCVACDVAYHVACLDEGDVCARAGHRMSELAAEAALRERVACARAVERGRSLTWSAVVPFVLCDAALVLIHAFSPRPAQVVQDLVRFAIGALVFSRALRGSEGARRLLAILAGIGAVVGLALLANAGDWLMSVVAGSSAANALFACWVFGFSEDAATYLERSRDQ